MPDFTESATLKQLQLKYHKLIEENNAAIEAQEKRDILIQKTKLAIEAFTPLNSDVQSSYEYGSVSVKTGFIYPRSETWLERIKAYMKFKNTAVTIAEMVDVFIDYEKDYTRDKLQNALNNTVQTMIKRGLLKIYKPPIKRKGFFYANPTWFEGDELKEEYKPNLTEVW